MHRIALAGVKHCGKSTIGRLIAAQQGGVFRDLDDLILELLPAGFTVRSWYREKGQEAFRRMEEEALSAYLNCSGNEPFLCLSLGGGTMENPAARELLHAGGVPVIALDEDADVLYQRIRRGGLPPFLDTEDPEKTFRELYTRRSATLKEFCDLVVSIHGLPPREAAEKVISQIRRAYGR